MGGPPVIQARLAVLPALTITAVLASSDATAQADVGLETRTGLHWHVAAPADVDWRLTCRFRPITHYLNWAQNRRWANRLTREGRGPGAGRLPGDNGRCSLTRLSGRGPVGLALVKNGVAHASGTNDAARPATLNVF